MKAFMDEDFLLENETAKKLFHEHAHHEYLNNLNFQFLP